MKTPSVLFSGAWSGTASLWEFDCGGKDVESSIRTSSAASDYISGLVALSGLFAVSILFR